MKNIQIISTELGFTFYAMQSEDFQKEKEMLDTLHFSPLPAVLWIMKGHYQGLSVFLYEHIEGKGKHQTQYFAAMALFQEQKTERFGISKDTFTKKINNFLSKEKELKTGNEEIDKKYYLQGNDPQYLLNLLSNPIFRELTDEWLARSPRAEITHHGLEYKAYGAMPNPIKVREILTILIDTTNKIANH